MIPEFLPEATSSTHLSLIAGLGVVITMLAGSLVLLAKMLVQTREVNAAVNNRAEGDGLFAQIATIQMTVDKLLQSEEDFASKGWRNLPSDLDSAAKLTQTIRDLQATDKEVRDAFDMWPEH